jgi:hypothetical protein
VDIEVGGDVDKDGEPVDAIDVPMGILLTVTSSRPTLRVMAERLDRIRTEVFDALSSSGVKLRCR